MPQLSLTEFVDIVSKSGSPKATKVAQVKARPEYDPAFDFYKPLREGIVDIHRLSSGKTALGGLIIGITDAKKLRKYPRLIEGYKKWWGRKEFSWFAPPRTLFTMGKIDIIVNPELGLEYNNERHITKLYFKDEKLSKLRIGVITYLMKTCFQQLDSKGFKFDILDVGNSKLFTGQIDSSLEPMLYAELAYISTLWDNV